MINMLDFIRASNLYKKYQVDDLLFVEFKCPYDDSKSGVWWHENYFSYIIAGQSLLKTPQSEYVLQPGSCVFARKGSVLTMSQTHEDFCELLIFVTDDFIKNVIRKYRIHLQGGTLKNLPDTIIPLEINDAIAQYFQSLLSYFSMPDPPPVNLLKLKFEELIVHVSSSKHQESLQCYFHELCTQAKPSIKDIMNTNFSSHLSLEEFARLCGRSLSGFKRAFTGIFHTTPGKWLLEKRLEYSRYLLDTTDLTVDEVCFESGFENRSHFIKVFRTRFGLTPGRLSGAARKKA